MTSLQSTVHDLTEEAAEELVSECLNRTALVFQRGHPAAFYPSEIAEMKLKALEGDVNRQIDLADLQIFW